MFSTKCVNVVKVEFLDLKCGLLNSGPSETGQLLGRYFEYVTGCLLLVVAWGMGEWPLCSFSKTSRYNN